MTSNKKRVRLSDIIGPAFYETHKLIDMGVIDEAVESGGRASLKSSYVGTEVVLQLVKHPDCHALVTRQVGDTMRDSVYLPTIIFTRWSSGAHPLPDGSRSGTACTALTTKAHWGGACRWQACHNMSGWKMSTPLPCPLMASAWCSCGCPSQTV